MEIIRTILRAIMDCVRYLLSKPDERGYYTSDLFRLRIRKKVRQLINKESGFSIDIGCKEGLLYEGLLTKENKLKITGVDIDYDMLKSTQEIFRNQGLEELSFVNACARHLPFRDNSIDIAVCINTFYNFNTKDDVAEVLKEMIRVCKRDGFFVFDIRNRLNPFVYYGFKLVWLYDNREVVLRAYSLREITELLSSNGIVINEIIPIGFPITTFAPAILVKAEHKKA